MFANQRLIACLILITGLSASLPAQADEVSFGGEIRMRGYSLENMWDVDSDTDGDRWSTFRQRTRLWANINLADGVTGYVRLTNQHWGEGVTYTDGWEVDNKSDKVFVDNAWAEVPDLFGLPLSIRVGRQDVMYGSGFVLFDGQSQMASTSNYFDGVRARWALGPIGVDMLYFKDQENQRDNATHDDVTLTGIYIRPNEGLHPRELYLLHRSDQGLDRDIGLLGARIGGGIGHLVWSAEAGAQRGDATTSIDHEAWGLTTEARYMLIPGRTDLTFIAGFTALSGDDPATPNISERWDVFYGGWPRYGDLLAWTFLNLGTHNAVSGFDPNYADGSSQTGEVVYGNLLMPSAALQFKPLSDLRLKLTWSPLRAHRIASGSDKIGDLLQLSAKYHWSADVSFSMYAARLSPGAAYGANPDPVHEAFWEMKLNF